MSDVLANIRQVRLLLVDARSNHRTTQDNLKRVARSVRKEVIAGLLAERALESNAAERKQQVDDGVEEDQRYLAAFASMRSAERRAELIQANLENALMEVRQDEWLVRDRLADAIAEYSTRPCLGVKEHGVVDTLVDSTGDHGVFGGESRYIRDVTRIA